MKIIKILLIASITIMLIGATACTPKQADDGPVNDNGDDTNTTQNGDTGNGNDIDVEDEDEPGEPGVGDEENDPVGESMPADESFTLTDEEGNIITMETSDDGTSTIVTVDDEGNEVVIETTGEDGDSVIVTGEEGEVEFYSSDELPENWPEDVPIMEGFTIKESSGIEDSESGEEVLLVVMLGEIPTNEVEEFYSNLPGWESMGLFSSGTSSNEEFLITILKDDEMIQVSGALDEDGQTVITLVYAIG